MCFLRITFLSVIIGLVALTSCKKEEEVKPSEIQLDFENPESFKPIELAFSSASSNEVMTSISIENGVLKNGTCPSPSGGYSAPKISIQELDDTLGVMAGEKLSLNIDISGRNNYAGYYFSVVGSDKYIDIPARGELTTGSNVLEINIPESLAGSKFQVVYSVYDSTGLVSNKITSLVQVYSIGGRETEFLTSNEWSMKKIVQGGGDDEAIETTIIGQTYYEKDTLTCYSNDFPREVTNKIPYTFEYRHEYSEYKFFEDGTVNTKYKSVSKTIDNEYDACESGVRLKEDSVSYELKGTWGYDSGTGTLSISFGYNVGLSKVTFDGDNMAWSSYFPSSYDGNSYFQASFFSKK